MRFPSRAELCLVCTPSPETGLEPEGERMPAVQHLLLFARPLAARVRSVRRPFRPSAGQGAYRLPHDVRDRLTAALAPFRNREAAFSLATFLARFHSNPDRLLCGFMIDRRELADRPDLQLTEARVRGAIKALEAIGYLERGLTTGSTHTATQEGLRRKPIAFVFGPEFAPLFRAANTRARRAKGGVPGARRALMPSQAPRPAGGFSEARATKSPKDRSIAKLEVNLGQLRKCSGLPADASAPSPLERALQRLKQEVFGKAEGGS
jgi:hypothetical protein